MSTVLSQRTDYGERRERSRLAIRQAAVALLGEGRAYAELSVGEITAAAGVSRPTFYAHFADKRILILALAAEFEQQARAAARPWLEGQTDDLRLTLEAVLGAFTAHASTVKAVVEAATYDAEVAQFWRGFHEWFVQAAVGRAQRADPALGDEAAEALSYSLVWMTERTFTEHLTAPRLRPEALLDALQRLWETVVPASIA